MRYVMYGAICLFFGFAIYQFWDENVENSQRSHLCHTFYFILPNIINQVANGFFFFVGKKVSKTVDAINEQ